MVRIVTTHSALQAGTPLAWNGVPEVQIGKDKSGSNGRIRASMMIDDYKFQKVYLRDFHNQIFKLI